MAARKKTVTKAVSPLDQPERFRLGEVGALALRVFNGVTQDELRRELNWPNSITTYKQMSDHSAINAPLTLFSNIIAKATWIISLLRMQLKKRRTKLKSSIR